MAKYLIIHRHQPSVCVDVYAAWDAWDSPLVPTRPPETCRRGDHTARWIVDADDARAALALLPPTVARDSDAFPIGGPPPR